MTTWDLLLPTIPHRHALLCPLLAELDRQWQPGFGMILYRDNMDRPGLASYGKWQDLMEASAAEYISFIGDDDWVAPDFVGRVLKVMEEKPDYVGYPVKYTRDGVPQVRVEHSLRHGRWNDLNDAYRIGMLVRDIVHHNPIRRELALLARWGTAYQHEDYLWSCKLRETGKVRTEAWIPEPMYYYQETAQAWTHLAARKALPGPMPEDEIPPLPQYHWLTVLGR